MKRFAIATALAVAIGLGTAGTADAQYVTQYNRVTPNGGVVTTSQIYNLGTYQSYNSYVSPYGTVKQSGGFIYCDSAVGVGTTFTVYLPVVADASLQSSVA